VVARSEFVTLARNSRARKQLHQLAQARLIELLGKLYPDASPVSEVSGVLGGRNDLIQFFFSGRRVVFELFFSVSQVPQDLRLLEQSEANVKIAVLIDREVDERLAQEYFRKKPNAFPFLWLSDLLVDENESITLARLRELVDEESTVIKLRRVLASPAGTRVEGLLRTRLEEIERVVTGDPQTPSLPPGLTISQAIALRIVGDIRAMGVPAERLRSLYEWLKRSIDYGFTLAIAGFQAFLVTDLDGQHAIWSDSDLADDLILGAGEGTKPAIVVYLNQYINKAWRSAGLEPLPIRFHFTHNHEELADVQVNVESPEGPNTLGSESPTS
jgi:hypothetical protein